MKADLSAREARRLALAAQGFGKAPPAAPGRGDLLRLVRRLGVVQMDSVNVLARSHYLPFHSRLGAYPRKALEDLAWGDRPGLFEYWMHEASLASLEVQPLLRWRMEDAGAGVGVWRGVAAFLRTHGDFIDRVLAEIRDRGPLSAAELGLGARGAGGWWGWSEGKRALECLFWTGRLTTAARRGAFERVYGLPEQVHPPGVLAAPTPNRGEAQRALLRIAARAQGVATEADLRDYFRMPAADARMRVAELVEAGDLTPVRVEGWRAMAYLSPDAGSPRRVKAEALLSPFDNLIWFRDRAERLFDVRIRLEIYTPAPRRVHGYYVLPFLEGEAITARVDLKADRRARRLRVQAAHAEPSAGPQTPEALARALSRMASWLGLEAVEVEPKGDLAGRLAGEVARLG
ncbi:MAG: hypothetical protein RL588_1213 [Pseudomonadota bacterium]